MDKSFIADESAYVKASIGLIATILVSYLLFIAVFPVAEVMVTSFTVLLDGNQFYSNTLADRLNLSLDFGWKMPFIFIAIGFIFVIVRTIIKQRYTRTYSEDEY